MCRKGRMFAPTKTWRRWGRKINVTQKRYAVASALAATAVPALVMARGHVIDEVPEIPLVLENAIESTKKTSQAKDILVAIGAGADLASGPTQVRAGKGKMRNRRYLLRRGPLVIYAANDGVEQAFRNLPGVELCCVDRLNLLQLAPGGHMGRFCIWSQAAFEKLEQIYGEAGKRIPAATMVNADLARIINSDEIQSILNPAKEPNQKRARKANPLRNIEALEKLDPYAAEVRRGAAARDEAFKASKADRLKAKQAEYAKYKEQGEKFIEQVSKQGDVCINGFTLE